MRKIVAIYIFFNLLIYYSCTLEKEKMSDPLVGKWNARWELINPEMINIFEPDQMIMHGEVIFNQDNYAKIRAFGFEGCAFTSDTSENQLIYKKNDSTINLLNSNNEVIFSYFIKDEGIDFVQLLLMDDIELTLTR